MYKTNGGVFRLVRNPSSAHPNKDTLFTWQLSLATSQPLASTCKEQSVCWMRRVSASQGEKNSSNSFADNEKNPLLTAIH